jgi:hypothetical protein
MKAILFILGLMAITSLAQARTYETVCNNHDCFKNGWVTTSKSYVMKTQCTNNDCTKYGWFSLTNNKSTYNVKCRAGGCFNDGWMSAQVIKGRIYYDDAFCKHSSCLTYGWNVKTGYDLLGGNVVCNNNDCAKYGGRSFWRGRPSRTVCYANDCYRNGWTLYVY